MHNAGGQMPSLQVRELPEHIYHLLQQQARKEHRSLAQEAVVTLAKGLQVSLSHRDRRQKLLAEIARQPACEQADSFDPVKALRQDRAR